MSKKTSQQITKKELAPDFNSLDKNFVNIHPSRVSLSQADAYDRFASLLTSLLIFVSVFAITLFGLWVSTGFSPKKTSVAVQLEHQFGDMGGLGENRRLDPDVTTPGEAVEFDEPTFTEAVERTSDVIANQSALFANPAERSDSVLTVGATMGDGSAPGTGSGRYGRRRHWEVQFHDQRSLQAYAQQLDYFGIELAIMQPGGNVMYFSNLSQPMPTIRRELASGEQRYYLTWLRPELQASDRELIAKANIAVDDKQVILKFLPTDLEQRLAQLENEAAGDRMAQLRATYFTVRQNGRNYEFYVSRQSFEN